MPDRRDGSRSSFGEELSEPWRWGLETSNFISRRLLDLYGELGSNGSRADLDEELRRARIDIERWVDLSVELFDRSFRILRRLAADGSSDTRPDSVSLDADPGTTACGEMWLHNVSAGEQTSPGLHCPGLWSAGGAELEGSRIRFVVDPGPLPGRSSRRVAVVVDVPASASPGAHHGVILSDASPEVAIPLRVVVRPADAPEARAPGE